MNLKAILTALILLTAVMLAAGLQDKPQKDDNASLQEPRVEKREAFLVAGVSVENTMEQEAMMGVWMKFLEIAEKIPTAIGDVYYGVNYVTAGYDPMKETGYGYMAATEIKSEEGLPEGLTVRKVPASMYLVFIHKGPVQEMMKTFQYIYEEYMPKAKYKALTSDTLEVYGEDFKEDSPDSMIEIWIPVKPIE